MVPGRRFGSVGECLVAQDPQQVQAAGVIGAGLGGVDDDVQLAAGCVQDIGIQRERPDAGVRSAMDQILRATLTDKEVCRAFENVAYMVTHPGTLADPAILERAQRS
jgi:hypothetical protein